MTYLRYPFLYNYVKDNKSNQIMNLFCALQVLKNELKNVWAKGLVNLYGV
jgi:hypothetical protein